IHALHRHFTGGGIHFAAPSQSKNTQELDLVRGALQMMQGLSSSIFYWDNKESHFRFKTGIYVAYFSQTSLYGILEQFSYAATCLQLVDMMLSKIEKPKSLPPTLRAFASCTRTWLNMMRNYALTEEAKINSSTGGLTPTILGLASSLSRSASLKLLCSGADYLFQIVYGAIAGIYFKVDSGVPATHVSVHILNHLYVKFNEICLLQGGQEDAYKMLLYILVGTLLPYIETLDSWLFQGTLDDPFEEMFFVANKGIAIHDAEFWEKSYQLRPANAMMRKEENWKDFHACPFFIKDIARRIISSGKSFQLIQHTPFSSHSEGSQEFSDSVHNLAGLSLSEAFCISVAALIDHGDHIGEHLWRYENKLPGAIKDIQKPTVDGNSQSHKFWQILLDDTLSQKRNSGSLFTAEKCSGVMQKLPQSYCHENPTVTVCQSILKEIPDAWSSLNISQAFCLPPLNDESLREAISNDDGRSSIAKGTDYTSGFHFGDGEYLRFLEDAKTLETLLPFPTLLPRFGEDLQISEILPFHNNSTVSSKILSWIQNFETKTNLLPSVILQECLIFYIKKQADYIGRNILRKLLHDWRLLDELGVLRAVYLLGSGDLMQHFLSVIFNKLDKGVPLDDDFELNTILQESISNSADNVVLSSADRLVVSVAKNPGSSEDKPQSPSASVTTPRKVRGQSSGMDALDPLKFTYKVSWPHELIVNSEALRKYNQVMIFLLKVKRAKYVLEKSRKWMWKNRGSAKSNRHWLLEQKLLHFVNAFHQYVMDRVYHNAWRELCEGVTAAGSLDEAMEAHESYLQSILRQCFVVPDKLGGLIASRISGILGLALELYSVQQTLNGGGGGMPAVRSRCGKEVERIEKQFNECMAFLLRILSVKLNVGQFPHLAALVTRINFNCFYMSAEGGIL
ncbi:hypothetical protein M569_07824, partial [Genlisea aurea]